MKKIDWAADVDTKGVLEGLLKIADAIHTTEGNHTLKERTKKHCFPS